MPYYGSMLDGGHEMNTERTGSVPGADKRSNRKPRPITDNVPEKITAHTVRFLRPCKSCGGIGDYRQMLRFEGIGDDERQYHHTSCYAKAHASTLHTIGPSNVEKLRLCDLSHLTRKQKDAVLATWRNR